MHERYKKKCFLCILPDHLRLHEYQGALEDVKQLLPMLDCLQGGLPTWIKTSEKVEHRMADKQIIISYICLLWMSIPYISMT